MQLEFTEQGSQQVLSVLDEIIKGLDSLSKPRRPVSFTVQAPSGLDQKLSTIQNRLETLSATKPEIGIKFNSSATRQIETLSQKASKAQADIGGVSKHMTMMGQQAGTAAGKIGMASAEQLRYTKSIDTSARSLDTVSKKIIDVEASFSAAQKSTDKAANSFSSIGSIIGSLQSSLNGTDSSLANLWKQMNNVERASREAYRMTEMFGRSAKGMERIAYVTPYLTDLVSQFVELPKEVTQATTSISRFMLKASREARGIDEITRGLADVQEEFSKIEGSSENLKRALSFKDGIEGLTRVPQIMKTLGVTVIDADKKFSNLEQSISRTTGRSVNLRGELGRLSPQYKMLSVGFKVFDRGRDSINLIQKALVGLAIVSPRTIKVISQGFLDVLVNSRVASRSFKDFFDSTAKGSTKVLGIAKPFSDAFLHIHRIVDDGMGYVSGKMEGIGKSFVDFKVTPSAKVPQGSLVTKAVDTGSTVLGKSLLYNAKQIDRFREGLLGATDDAIGLRDRFLQLSDSGVALANIMTASPLPWLSAIMKLLKGDFEGAGKTILNFGKKMLVAQVSSRALKGAMTLVADSSARMAVINKIKQYLEGAGISMDTVSKIFKNAWNAIVSVTSSAEKTFKTVFTSISKKMENVPGGKKILDLLKSLRSAFSVVGTVIKAVFNGVMGDAEKSGGAFSLLAKGFNTIKKAAKDAKEAATGKYQELTKGFKKSTSPEEAAASTATETGRKKGETYQYSTTKTLSQEDIDTAKKRVQTAQAKGKTVSTLDADIASAQAGTSKTLTTSNLSELKSAYKSYGFEKATKSVKPPEPEKKGFKIPGLDAVSGVMTGLLENAKKVYDFLSKHLTAAVEAVTKKIQELGKVAFGESVFPDMGKWIDFVVSRLVILKNTVSSVVESVKSMVFPKYQGKGNEENPEYTPYGMKDSSEPRKRWSTKFTERAYQEKISKMEVGQEIDIAPLHDNGAFTKKLTEQGFRKTEDQSPKGTPVYRKTVQADDIAKAKQYVKDTSMLPPDVYDRLEDLKKRANDIKKALEAIRFPDLSQYIEQAIQALSTLYQKAKDIKLLFQEPIQATAHSTGSEQNLSSSTAVMPYDRFYAREQRKRYEQGPDPFESMAKTKQEFVSANEERIRDLLPTPLKQASDLTGFAKDQANQDYYKRMYEGMQESFAQKHGTASSIVASMDTQKERIPLRTIATSVIGRATVGAASGFAMGATMGGLTGGLMGGPAGAASLGSTLGGTVALQQAIVHAIIGGMNAINATGGTEVDWEKSAQALFKSLSSFEAAHGTGGGKTQHRTRSDSDVVEAQFEEESFVQKTSRSVFGKKDTRISAPTANAQVIDAEFETVSKKVVSESKKAGDAIGGEIDKGAKKATKAVEDFGEVAYGHSVLPDTGKAAQDAGKKIGDEIGKGSSSAIDMLKRLPKFIQNLPSSAINFAKKFIPKFVWDLKDLIPIDTLKQAAKRVGDILSESTPEPVKGFASNVRERLQREAKAARLVKAPVVGLYNFGKASVGKVAATAGKVAVRAVEGILGFDIAEPFRLAEKAVIGLKNKTVEVADAIMKVDYKKLGIDLADAIKTMDVKKAATAVQAAFQHIDIVTPIKEAAKALREFDYVKGVKTAFTAFGTAVVGTKNAIISMKDGAKMSWFAIKTLVTQGPVGFGKMLREGANIERTIQSMGGRADELRAKLEKSNPELSMMGRLWARMTKTQDKLIPGLSEAKQQPGLLRQAGTGIKGFIGRDWKKTKEEFSGVGRSLREVGLRETLSRGKERLSAWWQSPISGQQNGLETQQTVKDITSTKTGEYLGKASDKLKEKARRAREQGGFFRGLKATAFEKLSTRIDPVEIQKRKQDKINRASTMTSAQFSPKELIMGDSGIVKAGGMLSLLGGLTGAAIGAIGLGGSVATGAIGGAIGGGMAGWRHGNNIAEERFQTTDKTYDADREESKRKLRSRYAIGGAIAGGIAGAGAGLILPGMLATGGLIGALGGGVHGFVDKNKYKDRGSYYEENLGPKTTKERFMSAGLGAVMGGLAGLLGAGGIGALGGLFGGATKGAVAGGGIGSMMTDAGGLFFKTIGDGFKRAGTSILKAFPEIKTGMVAAGTAIAPGTIGATIGTFQRKVKGAGDEGGLTKERADEISKSLKESVMGEKFGGLLGKLPQAIAGINTSINRFMSTSVGAASAGGVDKLIDISKLPGKLMSGPGKDVGVAAKTFAEQGSIVHQFKSSKKILQESGMYSDTLRDKIKLIGDAWNAVDVRSRIVGATFKAILAPVRMLKGGASDFEKALDNISPIAGAFYTSMTATNTLLQKLSIGAEKLARLPEARIFQVKSGGEVVKVLGSYAVKAAQMGSKAIRDRFDSAITGNERTAKTSTQKIGGFFRNIASAIAHPQKAFGQFIAQGIHLERTLDRSGKKASALGSLQIGASKVMRGPSAAPIAAYVADKTKFPTAPKKGPGSLMYRLEKTHEDNPLLSGMFRFGKRAMQTMALPGLKGIRNMGIGTGIGTALGAGVGLVAGGLPGAAVGAKVGAGLGGLGAQAVGYYNKARLFQKLEKASDFSTGTYGGLSAKTLSLASQSFNLPSPMLGGAMKEAKKSSSMTDQFKASYKILGDLNTYTDSWGGKLRQAYDAIKTINVGVSIAGKIMAPLAGKSGSFANDFVRLNPSMGAVIVSLKAANAIMTGLRTASLGVQSGITSINAVLNKTFNTNKIDIAVPFKKMGDASKTVLAAVESRFKSAWEFIKRDASKTVSDIGGVWNKLSEVPGIKQAFGKQMKGIAQNVGAYVGNITSDSPKKWSEVKPGNQATKQQTVALTGVIAHAKRAGSAIGNFIAAGAKKATDAIERFAVVTYKRSVLPDTSDEAAKTGKSIGERISEGARRATKAIKDFGNQARVGKFQFTTDIVDSFKLANVEIENSKKKIAELQGSLGSSAQGTKAFKDASKRMTGAETSKQAVIQKMAETPGAFASFKYDILSRKQEASAARQRGDISTTDERKIRGELDRTYVEVSRGVKEIAPGELKKKPTDIPKDRSQTEPDKAKVLAGVRKEIAETTREMSGLNTAQKRLLKAGQEEIDRTFGKGAFVSKLSAIQESSDKLKQKWDALQATQEQLSGGTDKAKAGFEGLYAQIQGKGSSARQKATSGSAGTPELTYEQQLLGAADERKAALRKLRGEQRGLMAKGEKRVDAAQGEGAFASSMIQIGASSKGIMGDLAAIDTQLKSLGSTATVTGKEELKLAQAIEVQGQQALNASSASGKQEQAAIKQQLGILAVTSALQALASAFTGVERTGASLGATLTENAIDTENVANKTTGLNNVMANAINFLMLFSQRGSVTKAVVGVIGNELLGTSTYMGMFAQGLKLVLQEMSTGTGVMGMLSGLFKVMRGDTEHLSGGMKLIADSGNVIFAAIKKAAFSVTGFQTAVIEAAGGSESMIGSLAAMHPAVAGIIAGFAAWQAVGRQVAAVLKDILDIGGKVQTQLLRTQGLLAASDSGDAFGSLKDTIYELGAKTEFTTQQVAQASNALLQLGFSGKEAEGSLRAVIDAASANQIPLEQAAEAAANTIRQFSMKGDPAKNAEDALGALSAISFNTGADITSLQMAMRNVGPTAQILGLEVGEAAAVLGTFGNVAIRYGRAGTNLNNILSRMATQPAPARKAFQALGIEVSGSDGKFRKFSDIIGDVSKKFVGMTDAQKATYAKMIAGQQSMAAFLTLVDTGKDTLDELTEKTKTGADINKKMAEDFRAGWEGSVAGLQSAIEGVKLTAFDILSRGATSFVQILTGLVTLFNKVLIGFREFALPVIGLTGTIIETMTDLTKVTVGLSMINVFPTIAKGASLAAMSISQISPALEGVWAGFELLKASAKNISNIKIGGGLGQAARGFVSGGAAKLGQVGSAVGGFFTKITGSSEILGSISKWAGKGGSAFAKMFSSIFSKLGFNIGSIAGFAKIIGKFAQILQLIQLIILAWKEFKDAILFVVKILQIGFQVIDIAFKLVLKTLALIFAKIGLSPKLFHGANNALDKTIQILDGVQKAIDGWSLSEFESKFEQLITRVYIAAIRAMADVAEAASKFGGPKKPKQTLDENGHLVTSDDTQETTGEKLLGGYKKFVSMTPVGMLGRQFGKKTSSDLKLLARELEYVNENKQVDVNKYGDQGLLDPEAEAERKAQLANARYEEQVSQMKFGREQKKQSRRSTVSIYMEWMQAEVGSEKWTELDQQLKARSTKNENMLSSYYLQQGEILQKTMDAFAAKGVDIPTDSTTYAAIAQVIREKGSITAEGLKSLGVAIPEQDALEADLLADLKKFATNIKKIEADGGKATVQNLEGLNIPKEIRQKVLDWMRSTNVDTISAEDFKTLGIKFPDAEKIFQEMVDSLQNTKLTTFEAWVQARPKIHITMEQAAAIDEKIVGMQEAKEDREKKLLQAKSTWELMLELETVDLNSEVAFNILTELELRKNDEDFESQLTELGEDIQTTYAERIEQIKQLADEQRVTARKRATDKLKSRSSVDLAIEMEGLDPNSVEFAQAANEIMGRGEGEMEKAQAAAQRVFEIDLEVKRLEDVKSAKDATLALSDAVLAVRDKADSIGQIDLAAKLRVEEIGLKVRQFLIEPFDQFKDKIGEIKGKFADMIQGIQGKRIDIKEKLGLYGSEADQDKLFGLQQKLRNAKSTESKEAINKQIEKQREKMGIDKQASGERLDVLTQREGMLKQELQLAGTAEKKATLSEKLADLLFQKSEYAPSASEGKMFGQEAIFATQQAEKFAMEAQRKAIEKERLQQESDLKQKGILTEKLGSAESPEAKASILEKLIPIVEKGGELGTASEMVRLNEELSAAVVKKAEEQVAREKEALDIQKESLQIQRLQLERLQLILDKNVEAVQNQKEKKPGSYNAQKITLNGGVYTNVS